MPLNLSEIKELLEIKAAYYNRPEFIASDPISVPHLFDKKEDIEIAGFLTATISWGQRKTIIANARKLMGAMDFAPYAFIMQAGEKDLAAVSQFTHRTFNPADCQYFLKSLQHIYQNHGGLEAAFNRSREKDILHRIVAFRDLFFELPGPERVEKHVADPRAGSPAKRINMFLRWMVRKDDRGVDFGIWDSIPPSQLMCPLDIHSGTVARKMGLIHRKQNDWKALEELMAHLINFDPKDPAKYDYALFGLGIFEGF